MPGVPAVRVATLNLLNNAHGRWADRERLVIEQGRALAADVYAFQEVDGRSDQVERLRAGLGDEYEAVALPHPDLALRAQVDVGDGVLLTVATTHLLFSPSRKGSETRRAQVEHLLAWIGDPGGPLVIMGDFNSRHQGAAVRAMKERFRSAYERVHGSEPDVTHPTPLVEALDVQKAYGVPLFPEGTGAAVDYVFVGEGVDVEHCAVAWNEPAEDEPNLYPSDHFGLVADLRIS